MAEKNGFIKDYRKELDSDIWLMSPMYHRVWQWIKYSANHAESKIPNKDGSFTIISSGQHATSYRLIAKGVGYYEGKKWKEPNVKTIKSILDWLVKQKMICVQGNTLGTILTVENWELYQSEINQGNTKRITLATRGKHSMDTNKNDKECIRNIYVDFFNQLWQLYPKKEGKGQVSKTQIEKLYKIGPEEMTRAVDRYKKEKQGTEKQFLKNGSTFFNSGYVDYLDANYQQEEPETLKAKLKTVTIPENYKE